ncbi:transglycosylase family protein [Ornithinimicrobium sp. Y1847]|uniref:transglycosylase family protein n=1 Tax=Ornithinimicrobium sp. Y1847 TaxID=3405419 RepID=UPI003B67E474
MPPAKHRTTPARRGLRRAGSAAIAGAASVAGVGLVAQPAAANDNVWDRVAHCESTGNWSINTGNGFYGGLQFWHPTWTSFGGGEFAPYAHQATKLQQITVAQRVLRVQGPGAWPVCSVRAGLTMTNGLAPYPGQDAPAPAPAPSPAPAPGTSGTWYVSATPGANIRSGPSTSHRIVGGASTGSRITGTLSNGWVRIADGRFISQTTLTTSAPAPAPSPSPSPSPSPAPPSASGTWWVSANVGANIRSGPGTNFRVVGGAAKGTQITGTLSNGWVNMGNGRFISHATLTGTNPGGSTPAPAPGAGEVQTWRVNAPIGANIRAGAGTNTAVIGGASHGTTVRGTLSNGWVKLDGRSGWISASILVQTG